MCSFGHVNFHPTTQSQSLVPTLFVRLSTSRDFSVFFSFSELVVSKLANLARKPRLDCTPLAPDRCGRQPRDFSRFFQG